jgi:hypothetical protein
MRRYRYCQPQCLENTGAGPFFSIDDWTVTEGVFSLETFFKMADWTPAANRSLVQHGSVDGNISFAVDVLQPNGDIRVSYFPTGLLASRISQTVSPPQAFRDNRIGGIRCSFFANFFGVSGYQVDFNYGAKWRLGPTVTAAASAVFNSTAVIDVGAGDGIERIYAFRVWNQYFGISGFPQRRTLTLDALSAPQPLNTTDWTDRFGNHCVLGNAAFRRSDYPVAYAA